MSLIVPRSGDAAGAVMSALLIAFLLIALPALALILYRLWRRRAAPRDAVGAAAAADPKGKLQEEKATAYRALRELEFGQEAGCVSDEDYRASRERNEARAAENVHALDELPAALVQPGPPASSPGTDVGGRRPARFTAALVAGIALLLAAGVAGGLLVGRSGTPRPSRPTSLPQPGERASAAATVPPAPFTEPATVREDALAGMLETTRQHLNQGRYKEAMAGYQAVVRQDSGNVEALTHIGLILAIGGHTDSALESFNKIIASNPDYPLAYFYWGQVLYRAKQDYAGAIRDWKRYLVLVPAGREHDNVAAFVKEALARQRP